MRRHGAAANADVQAAAPSDASCMTDDPPAYAAERAGAAPVVKAPEPAAPPVWATAPAQQQAEPAQDEVDIKDILRRMRFVTIGNAVEARTLLQALRDLRGSDKAAVLEAPA